MEIINASASVLSNYEVLQELKKYRSAKKGAGLRNLATITYETLQSLETSAAQHQKAENIVQFNREMQKYNLTREEVLMMCNDPPTAAIHITVLIQFSEERLTEEQIEEIINHSKTYLLPTETEVNGGT